MPEQAETNLGVRGRRIDTDEHITLDEDMSTGEKISPHITFPATVDQFDWSHETSRALIEAIAKGWVVVRNLDKQGSFDLELVELSDLPETLAHVTSYSHYADILDFMAGRKDVWGDQKEDSYTYLQTTSFEVEGYFDNNFSIDLQNKPQKFIRIYVDTHKLKKVRGVFLDPESLDTTPEDFGKSFVVCSGIPRSAISKIEVVTVHPQEISPVETIDIPDYDEQTMKVQAESRKKKILEAINAG